MQVEPPVPHAPSSHCPGCENQHAQRVPVIFEALMAQIRSRRPNSGAVRVGAVLWGTFPGVGAKLSLAGDQHQLARRLAPPVIDSTNLVEAGRSRVAAAGGGALVAFLVVMIPLVVWSHPAPAGPEGPSPGPTHLPSFETALAIAALFGLPLLVFAKISSRYDAHIDRLRRAEWEAFDRRKQAWKSSFFCHACGKIFHPSGRAE
ncbi:MAG TPA: hypothetical protein VMF30_03835 [Pirellulales bacterium]|nr:hypothetical protein [Pirellulales bacterium]